MHFLKRYTPFVYQLINHYIDQLPKGIEIFMGFSPLLSLAGNAWLISKMVISTPSTTFPPFRIRFLDLDSWTCPELVDTFNVLVLFKLQWTPIAQ
jgi:hypothetical protein